MTTGSGHAGGSQKSKLRSRQSLAKPNCRRALINSEPDHNLAHVAAAEVCKLAN